MAKLVLGPITLQRNYMLLPQKNNGKARFSGPDGIGSIQIGPVNGDWAHIYTDRPSFIFNKDIYAIGGGFSAYNSSNLYLKTHGTVRMTIKKTNGFVGIGTTEPESKLDIRGDLYINSGDNHIYWRKNYMIMGTKPGDYAHNVLRLKPGGASNGYLNSTLEMYKANSETDHELRIKLRANGASYFNGGYVGIGTTEPESKLDIRGDLYINSGDNHIYWRKHYMTMGTKPGDYAHNTLRLKPGGASNGYLNSTLEMYKANSKTDHELRIKLRANGASYFNGGKVGIGTTEPESKLDIRGDLYINSGDNHIYGCRPGGRQRHSSAF